MQIVRGSVDALRDAIAESAGTRDVWIVGGGDLATQFWEAGMLDELIVSIAPVMLGSGKPLFTRRCDLELIELARNSGVRVRALPGHPAVGAAG